MIKRDFGHIKYGLAIICCISLPLLAVKQSPLQFPTLSVKLDASSPITFKPDLSNVGKELGCGIGSFFGAGARSFADTMQNADYGQDMSRGMSGLARNLGNSIGDFDEQAQKSLYPTMTSTVRNAASSMVNVRNALQFGGIIALAYAITFTGYYATKFIWELITHKVLHPKPVILLPDTKYGRWDRFTRWWKGYTSPAMIFDASVKDRLLEIEEKTKQIRSYNKKRCNRRSQMTYDNLLLHGKPGTGKTLFARILADHTNMDFVSTTAASLLQSGVAGVKYFNDIVAMARRSAYGLIIFIDEADALFVDRDTLSPDSDHYKVLSHILALTGEGNSTFMLIAATNHAYVMDSAMGRRFQDRILMPLPDELTREKLLTLYVKKILLNTKNNGNLFVQEAQKILFGTQNTTLLDLAHSTAGLSHAEIKDMIEAMHKKARASQSGMLTPTHIKQATDQAIEKHTALASDAIKKQQRFNNVAYAHES